VALTQLLQSLLMADVVRQEDLQSLAGLTHPDSNFEVTETELQRLELLRSLQPKLEPLCQQQLKIPHWLTSVWLIWLPLALHLAAQRRSQSHPLIQGILGGQGTGKTTLGLILTQILTHLGYKTLSFSLDDLYKTHADRLELRSQDPRLIWRGPPGTHDVALGIRVLDQLRQPEAGSIVIPRFDKSLHNGSGDRIASQPASDIEIVLFEGWFVGVPPIDPTIFNIAPVPILTAADRAFARDMNERLRDYQPLWQRLDRLIVLCPVDYRLSKQWRKQAEQQMKATGKSGMSDREIDAFVEYFWKALHPELFITPLVKTPGKADWVIEIQPDRTISSVYHP
jgi:D-glycerate 3-kinase